MLDQKHYRILTPDGRLSHDTFSAAAEQSDLTPTGCVIVANDNDGTQLTVHRERLFATADTLERSRACLRCGRVLGIPEDQVQCPYDDGDLCEMLQPPESFSADQPCAEHSA